MASVYTIQIYNAGKAAWGQERSFEEVGLTTAVRHLQNQGVDTCSLNFSAIRPPYLHGYPFGAVVRVLRDGVGWFVGTVQSPTRSASGQRETAKLVLNGPWWYLANLVYMQTGLYFVPLVDAPQGDPGAATGGPTLIIGTDKIPLSAQPVPTQASRIILTQSDDTAQAMSAADTIGAALGYAIAKGAFFQVGTVGIDQAIPSEEVTDPTCADVVKRCLRWLPGVTAWFDYSTTPPTLNIASRAARPVRVLQMGGEGAEIRSADLTGRNDLILPGVTIQYLRRISLAVTSGDTTTNTESYFLEVDKAGPDPTGIGALVTNVELTGGSAAYGSDASGDTFEATPVGLASTIYEGRKNLTFEGSIALVGQDIISGPNWIGRKVSITGGDEEWKSMAAEVQSVEESTSEGASTLTVGPPDHLGATDLAALLRVNRTRTPVGTSDTVIRTGGGIVIPPTNPLPPAPPAGGSNPGAYTGPPKGDPDKYETPNASFTGIIEQYSGTSSADTQGAVRFADTGAPLGYHEVVPLATAGAGDPPTSAGNFHMVGVGGGFFASYTGGLYCRDGGNNHWLTTLSCVESYSVGTLDLSGFTPLRYAYAELFGTIKNSRADGQDLPGTPYQIPVTGYLGQRCHNFRVYHTVGETVYDGQWYLGSGGGSKSSRSVVTLTGIRLIPRNDAAN